ncbi:MAG TPA: T9SS type A sorting domain-containing protein, partial [Chitinophaga sp.]
QADQVSHGYRNIFDKNFGDAGSCNNNVLCPAGNGWENERRSVALLLLANDTRWCSGALVNNANNTDIPYLLTAFHCVSGQSVTNWKFIFHYWSPTCTPNQNGSTSLLFNHANLRASYSPSDFALLQLQQTPAAGSGIAYAGWSRSATAPTNTTAIHHPSGDVMKITFDNQASVKTAYGGGSGNNHWQVNWDNGVTEPGSSGSPLFDQNHRIRGQLHGGPSSCTSSDKRDFYGSLDISWTGGATNSTRLRNWLDPGNLGVTTVDTRLAGTLLAPGSPVNMPSASPVHLFTVSPNPATDQVVVTLQKAIAGATHEKALQLSAEQAAIPLSYIRDVRIYDAAGKLHKHQRFNGTQPRVQLSVSGLHAGIYFVEVSDGKNKSVEEIIIH